MYEADGYKQTRLKISITDYLVRRICSNLHDEGILIQDIIDDEGIGSLQKGSHCSCYSCSAIEPGGGRS